VTDTSWPPSGPTSLQETVPAYLYKQYEDDDDLQAFFGAYNQLVTQYVYWFATTVLANWTSPLVTGALLDWIAEGLYGMARPTLYSGGTKDVGALNTWPLDSLALNAIRRITPTSYFATTDDVFKRVLTWHLFKGDGKVFNIRWLKRHVMRFLTGANGSAPNVDQTYQISVTFGVDGEVTILIIGGLRKVVGGALLNQFAMNSCALNSIKTTAQQFSQLAFAPTFVEAVQSGALELPFQFDWNPQVVSFADPSPIPPPQPSPQPPKPVFMHVQGYVSPSESGGANVSAAFGSAVQPGDAVLGGVVYDSTTNLQSIADDKSNLYKITTTSQNGATGKQLSMFYLEGIANGPRTLTFFFSGNASGVRAIMDEFSGVYVSGALDVASAQYQSAPGIGTNAASSGAQTTTTAVDLIYGVTDAQASNPLTAGSGFTILEQGSVGGGGGGGATSYTLSGPSSVKVGQASANFSVQPNASGSTATITPSDGGNGGTFSPATVAFDGTTAAKTFTYTPLMSASNPGLSLSISTSNNGGLTDPSGVSLSVSNILNGYPSFTGSGNSGWQNNDTTHTTGGVADPFGGTAASVITETTATGGHYIYQSVTLTASQTYEIAAWVKPGAGSRNLFISFVDNTFASTAGAIFNPSTGALVSTYTTGSGSVSSTGSIVGQNGWQLVWMKGTIGNYTSAQVFVSLASGTSTNYAGDGSSSLDVYGPYLD